MFNVNELSFRVPVLIIHQTLYEPLRISTESRRHYVAGAIVEG